MHQTHRSLFLSIIALTAVLIVASGCAQHPTGNELYNTKTTENQPITLGGLFHLTGDGAFWGTGERNGAQLAIEDINAGGGINGRQLQLAVEDGQTDFTTTVTAAKRLIDIEHVEIIIGPTWFGQAIAPVAEESHTLVLSPSTGGTVPRKQYFFNLWSTEQQEVAPLAEFMQKNNHTRIIIISTQNDWAASMKNAFVKEAQARGMTITAEFIVAPDEKDFRSIITQAQRTNADAVYGIFAFYPSQGHFSRQAKTFGLNATIYSTSDTEIPDLLQTFPEIDGTIYSHPDPGQREASFRERYNARFNITTSPSAAYAYDAVQLVAAAMRANATTPEDIGAYLETLDDYQGVSNTITFVNGRVETKPHSVKVVRDGRYEKMG